MELFYSFVKKVFPHLYTSIFKQYLVRKVFSSKTKTSDIRYISHNYSFFPDYFFMDRGRFLLKDNFCCRPNEFSRKIKLVSFIDSLLTAYLGLPDRYVSLCRATLFVRKVWIHNMTLLSKFSGSVKSQLLSPDYFFMMEHTDYFVERQST